MTLANILPQVIIVWIILLIVLYLILSKLEKRKWNHGICLECGKPWRYRYSSRKEGRVYYCKNGHYIKVKYGSDLEW